MKIYIKNMVCIRCQTAVKAELEKLGIAYLNVKIGEAEVMEEIDPEKKVQLKNNLKALGLLLMDDDKSVLIEKIKNTIINLVHFTEDQIKGNLSDFLSEKLNYNYTYLANIFSEEKGITIEKFYITHKIERVKELIIYDELNITEIAWRMHYSSVAHLSNQFKQYTGLTPTQYKNLKNKQRNTIEDL